MDKPTKKTAAPGQKYALVGGLLDYLRKTNAAFRESEKKLKSAMAASRKSAVIAILLSYSNSSRAVHKDSGIRN